MTSGKTIDFRKWCDSEFLNVGLLAVVFLRVTLQPPFGELVVVIQRG